MILVTGGTGYIGSHTAVELIENGYEVVVADNLSNSRRDVLDGIRAITGKIPFFEQIELCDQVMVKALFRKYPGITGVIHFAAYKAVGESVEKPLKYYENNLLSLIRLLNEMLANNIKNLVFSSSCTVYGQPEELPVTENFPFGEADSPYGNTKQIAEEIIKDTIKANNNLNCISLRYFNPIGAHPSALIGEIPVGIPNNLVPYITQTAAGVREELRIFGNDYNTPDGTCIRDYINVTDLAKAHIAALKRLSGLRNRKSYEAFNLGTGNGTSVLEVIRAFEKATGKKLKYRIVGRRPGDIERVFADTSLANRELGWRSETSLEDTLFSAWNWEEQYRKENKE
ncbi:MAG: UDP-glucose 4-epimerase GalE [Bacteroidetes bacterium]|nr:UDP-glucose 4-epimerase GalE [Bacteroidota bacterium]